MNLLEILAFACNEGDKDGLEFEVFYKGQKVEYLNEAGRLEWDTSKFFVAGFEFGASVLVHVESYRGDGFETAWAAWLDSMDPIPDSEIVEAYAPDRDSDSFDGIAIGEAKTEGLCPFSEAWRAEMDRAHARARDALDAQVEKASQGLCDYPEIVEGYEMRDDGRIVSLGHYAWMNEADLEDIEIISREP